MKNSILTALIMGFILCIFACHDEHGDANNAAAKIEIGSPSNNSLFYLNDTVNLSLAISSEEQMHGFIVQIKNTDASDTLVFDTTVHDHGTSISFKDTWINNVNVHSDMQLIVTAILDHDGNTLSDTTRFHCMPVKKP